MRNTRTIYLPNGGTMEIPLPGSNARFEVNPPSALAFSDGGSRVPTLMVGVILGAVAGTVITVWYLKRR
jgi:hypothetical protein